MEANEQTKEVPTISVQKAMQIVNSRIDRTTLKYIFVPPARPGASSISIEFRKRGTMYKFNVFFSKAPPMDWVVEKRNEMLDKGVAGDFKTYDDFIVWREGVMNEYRTKSATVWLDRTLAK